MTISIHRIGGQGRNSKVIFIFILILSEMKRNEWTRSQTSESLKQRFARVHQWGSFFFEVGKGRTLALFFLKSISPFFVFAVFFGEGNSNTTSSCRHSIMQRGTIWQNRSTWESVWWLWRKKGSSQKQTNKHCQNTNNKTLKNWLMNNFVHVTNYSQLGAGTQWQMERNAINKSHIKLSEQLKVRREGPESVANVMNVQTKKKEKREKLFHYSRPPLLVFCSSRKKWFWRRLRKAAKETRT